MNPAHLADTPFDTLMMSRPEPAPDQSRPFATTVRAHRQRMGLSQEELAERVGVSVRTVGNIEAGRVTAPRPVTVRLLANVFELTGADRDRFCGTAGAPAGTHPRAWPAMVLIVAVIAGPTGSRECQDRRLRRRRVVRYAS